MSIETGRDNFSISIRSAFLKKGTRQKFSLLTLIFISIIVISLEYFQKGPIDKFRSVTKDLIFKGSNIFSYPSNFFEEKYSLLNQHLDIYEKSIIYKDNQKQLEFLKSENEYFKNENALLKKKIDEKNLYSQTLLLSKVILDKQSPYLKSFIINKGFNDGLKIGLAVTEGYYYIGKIVDVNYLSSRVLLASDLNSKIPVIVEPGSINAILSGNGDNKFAELEYLPENETVKDGSLVFTSGADGIIPPAIPIGKVKSISEKKMVNFFVDFSQIKYVGVKK